MANITTSYENGKITFDILDTDAEYFGSVIAEKDGKILLAGFGELDFSLFQLNADGSFDTNFSEDGVSGAQVGDYRGGFSSATVQADGKIVAAGYANNGNEDYFALTRFNADGSPDLSFSEDGKLFTDFFTDADSDNSHPGGVAVQADGKIIVAGEVQNPHAPFDYDFALVRYNVDGSLDTRFSSDGKVNTDFNANNDTGLAVALQADGKILVAGYSENESSNEMALARYNDNGRLDASFASDGKLTIDFGPGEEFARSVAVLDDGKILVAGIRYNNGVDYDFALARLNSDGSFDTGFSDDGKLSTDISGYGYYDFGRSVAVQADGKILVAGISYNDSSVSGFGNRNGNLALVRYNEAGSLDTSFSGDGKLTTDFNSRSDYGFSVAVQADGKILVAGASTPDVDTYNNQIAILARYNADGSLDDSFNGAGVINNPPTGHVTIDDTTPGKGQTLIASHTLADVDGLGAISYHWQANGVDIGVGDSYTVTANEVGKAIVVTARYTDGLGTQESVSSAATANVTDTPATGIAAVIISGADFTTSEQGDTAVFSVKLNSAPTRNVTITFTSSDTSEGVLDKTVMTFTTDNWANAQKLTVTGQNDALADGDVAYTISANLSTIDVLYKNIKIDSLTLTNLEAKAADVETINGSEGVDILQGTAAPSYLLGLAGDDDLSGGAGNDTLYGSFGQDVLFGEEDNDELYGQEDADYLDGGAGNDILNGGLGKDTLIGGAGNDTYYLSEDQPTSPDMIDDQGLANDVDTVIMPYNWDQYTLPVGIENGAIAKGSQPSSLTGNPGNNMLTGNNGNNTLNGLLGKDSLFAGLGDDILKGGDAADFLEAGSGNDSVDAGAGNDVIVGGDGAGDDIYIGGAGIDTVKYTSAQHSIKVNLAIGTASGNDIDNDQLKAIESIISGQANDTLNGNSGNNAFDGLSGNDTITGSTGNDTLTGGAGNDKLSGGSGLDVFRFTSVLAASADTLTDFNVTDDAIQLENAIFKQLTATGELKAANFVKATAAADADDYVIYTAKTGALWYDADGDGQGAAQQIAVLGANLAITHANFVVI